MMDKKKRSLLDDLAESLAGTDCFLRITLQAIEEEADEKSKLRIHKFIAEHPEFKKLGKLVEEIKEREAAKDE